MCEGGGEVSKPETPCWCEEHKPGCAPKAEAEAPPEVLRFCSHGYVPACPECKRAEAPPAPKQHFVGQPVWEGDRPDDYPHENGNYVCMCADCGKSFMGHKRRVQCRVCAAAPAPKCNEWCRGDDHNHYCPYRSGVCKSACPICRPHEPAPPAPKCNHAKIDPSQPCDVCPPAPVSEVESSELCACLAEYGEASHIRGSIPACGYEAAPVSEPPRCKRVIYPDGPTCAEDIRALLDQINSLKLDRSEVIRDNTALKAQNAALEAERDNLRMLLAGSDYARVVAELARLRAAADRVVKHRNKHYRDVRETVDALESVLARSLRAAREGKK